MKRPKALFVLDEPAYGMAYGPEERNRIGEMVDLVAPPMPRDAFIERLATFRDVQILLSGWGAPLMDEPTLEAVPQLRAIFYAAGAVSGWMTPAVWDRGIVVSSAYAANAIPVAEYALRRSMRSKT